MCSLHLFLFELQMMPSQPLCFLWDFVLRDREPLTLGCPSQSVCLHLTPAPVLWHFRQGTKIHHRAATSGQMWVGSSSSSLPCFSFIFNLQLTKTAKKTPVLTFFPSSTNLMKNYYELQSQFQLAVSLSRGESTQKWFTAPSFLSLIHI